MYLMRLQTLALGFKSQIIACLGGKNKCNVDNKVRHK